MPRFFAACLIVLVSAWQPGTAHAQLYGVWHRPVDVEYERFSTDHFRVIYQDGWREEAGELAGLLEHALPGVQTAVGMRRDLDVPLVLNAFDDRSNGFVTSLPYRQEIDISPIRSHTLSPRLHGWFETVGPHELVHAVHAESGHGLGVGWMLRLIGPDLARSLNLSAPRGITEGLAVWHESRIRPHAGRLNHSLFTMAFRAAMESEKPWSLAQMLEVPAYTRPFDRYYHGGAHLFQYLSDNGDVPFFRRARDFYYRFPLLGFGPALWYGSRQAPQTLGRGLRSHFQSEAAAFRESLGELTEVDVVASERGTAHRRPLWLDDRTLLVYASGYHLRPGFHRIDAVTGERTPLAAMAITEDLLYAPDRDTSSVLFSRYVPDTFEPIRNTADVYRLDLSSGETDRLSRGGRLYAPVEAADGSLWAVRYDGPTSEWVAVRESGAVERIGAAAGMEILDVAPSPTTADVAVLADRGGRQGVYRAVVEGRHATRFEPWLLFETASIFDISWSEDGRYLLFSADPGEVANVFVWTREDDRVYQLTNVAYGALEPSLSPGQETLAFVNYRHERYDLATVPFDLSSARPWPRDSLLQDPALPPVATATSVSSASAPQDDGEYDEYRPLLSVRPRVAYPFLVYDRPTGDDDDVNLGAGAGAGIEWADPLQYWTAHTHLFYQHNAVWGRALVRSGRFMLRPSAEIFREPSTVVVRRTSPQGVDTVQVGREERGMGVAVRLPAVFQSNVFMTTAQGVVGAEIHSERLFDTEGETIRASERRVTLRPSLMLSYRMQSNPRDIVPNNGLSLSARSAVDVWTERERLSRWLRADGSAHLPVFRRSSTAVRLFGSMHVQNRGGLASLTTFFPRGYETETVFLGSGSFGKMGAEVTRPLWYIDDGFVLPPIYVRAVFAYGFVESMGGLTGSTPRRTVAGAGLGVQLRLLHGVDFTLRCAPVYRFLSDDWEITFR